MKRIITAIVLAAGLSVVASVTGFAGEWKQNSTGWWWQNDDGSYLTNTEAWLDGNRDGIAERYIFDQAGYLFTNTYVKLASDNGNYEDMGRFMSISPGIVFVNGDGAVCDFRFGKYVTQKCKVDPQTGAIIQNLSEISDIEYTEEQAALDAGTEYNMRYVREGYLPMIRGLIKEKQERGIHDYDHITDEEIAEYTDEQAQNMIVELLQ